MLHENSIPQEWLDILAKVQEGAPEAIIGGGALRDWYTGRTPKDLDIFVSKNAQYHTPQLWMGDGEKSATVDETLAYQIILHGASLPVNMIHVAADVTPMARFERFDFGICKIAHDGKQLIIDPEFEWDVKHHCITLRRADSPIGVMYSLARYDRIGKKFGWPMVIPETLTLPAFT